MTATTPPAGARDAVTDDMVERACAAFYSDLAWRTNSNQSRDFMRSALEAALTGKAEGGVGAEEVGSIADDVMFGWRLAASNVCERDARRSAEGYARKKVAP